MTSRTSLILILVMAVSSLSWQLGSRGLAEPDEGRTASIATEMYRSGDWITPRLYDATHFDKPPLIYWLIALSFMLGGANEWMARLPAALSGLGVILLTWATAKRLFGFREALYASLILLPCPLFFAMSHIIDPNMLLTACTSLALWAFVAWLQDGRPIQRWIFYLALGLACLAKGPVGILIVVLGLLGYKFSRAKELPWRRIWHGPGAAACLAIAIAWFVAVAIKYPELWNFFIRGELYERFFTNSHGRHEPLLYYLAIIPLGMLPWLPTLFPALRDTARTFRRDMTSCLLGSWVLWPTVMFSLSQSKMPTYVLPLLPAFAILMARRLSVSMDERKPMTLQVVFILALALILPVGFALHEKHTNGWDQTFVMADAPWLVAGIAVILASIKVRFVWRPALCTAMLLVSFLLIHAMIGRHDLELGPHSSTRGIGRTLGKIIRPDDRVVLLDRHPRGLSFYLDHPICLPTYKFRLQVPSDAQRLEGRLFDEAADVYVWFESTQRVFLVTSDKEIALMNGRHKRPTHELYRDGKCVLVSNQ